MSNMFRALIRSCWLGIYVGTRLFRHNALLKEKREREKRKRERLYNLMLTMLLLLLLLMVVVLVG
jgi:amino acid permease